MKNVSPTTIDFKTHVQQEAAKISGELISPENWKRNEIYFSMARIRSVDDAVDKKKGG